MGIFETFDISIDDFQYGELITKFKGSKAEKNKTILRHRFLNSRQQQGEELSVFIQPVIKHSHFSKLGDHREDMAAHVVINEIEGEKLKIELLRILDKNYSYMCETWVRQEDFGGTRKKEMKVKK